MTHCLADIMTSLYNSPYIKSKTVIIVYFFLLGYFLEGDIMKLESSFTDEAVLVELGKRVARLRIELSWTQAQLADRAGVGKRTVERLENGESIQLVNLMRVFRALDLIGRLDALLPELVVRPMDRLGRRNEPRKRASSPRAGGVGGASWVWEDER